MARMLKDSFRDADEQTVRRLRHRDVNSPGDPPDHE